MDCVISRLSLGTKNQDIEVWETSNLLIPLHPWMKKKQRGRERDSILILDSSSMIQEGRVSTDKKLHAPIVSQISSFIAAIHVNLRCNP